MPAGKLRVVILKPSKYGTDGFVERFRRGFMPNSTVTYLRSMTPPTLAGASIEIHTVDEYVQTDLNYLRLFRKWDDGITLVALAGVQSHQFQRGLDLAAYAKAHGVEHCVIGGPHPMTCDTSTFQNRGISFALAEAELIWLQILQDAIHGELHPVYGQERRWQQTLEAPILIPPPVSELRRHVVPMIGIYPARGCPFTCSFCSVIKIAGRRIRSQDVGITMASLIAAKAAGVKLVMFTSDNFNKYSDGPELLREMVRERLRLPFFVQCDTQIAAQENLVELLARAGCFQMFVGVESFNRKTLLGVHKAQNHPELYGEIVRLCRKYRIATHFSNIIGFPEDTALSIREHVETLRNVDPNLASFYVLTPIPGTAQYDDFLDSGWITETNLDRFDGTCPTWRHPSLTHSELQSLLFWSYKRFFSTRHVLSAAARRWRPSEMSAGLITDLAVPLFARFEAWRGTHPMSGGIARVRRDRASEYAFFRLSRYGCSSAPLPRSLALTAADSELNRSVH